MAEPLWGQGYAVEVSQPILAYCYDTLDMSVVRASIDAPNVASARVLEKLGFTPLRRATIGGLDLIFFDRVRLRADASAGQVRLRGRRFRLRAARFGGQVGGTSLRIFMPFKSKAQRRKFAELLVTGKISPETYEEWNRETGGKELPERVKKKAKAKKRTTAKRKARKATKARPKKR